MTDIITRQLLTASFRGVEFRIRSEVSPQNGRKIVLHEYLNSPQRFVEDLGQIPPTFQVEAFVHGPDTFKADSAALERALNQQGSGRLVMPVFGSVEAFALPYSKRASQQSVGEIVYSLEFAVGRPGAGPGRGSPTQRTVYNLGDVARREIENAFPSVFQIPTSVSSSTATQESIIDSVNTTLDFYNTVVSGDALTRLREIQRDVNANVSRLVNAPATLASILVAGTPDLMGLAQSVSIGISQAIAPFSSIIDRVNYKSSVPTLAAITPGRIQRNRNVNTIVNTTQVNALISSFEAAAAQTFQTTQQADEVRDQLEDAHERIMRIDTTDQNLIQSNSSVRSAVEDARLSALSVIGEKRQEAFQIQTVERGAPTPSFVESYSTYAEEFTNAGELESRALEIRSLNPSQQPIGLRGNVSVFRRRDIV